MSVSLSQDALTVIVRTTSEAKTSTTIAAVPHSTATDTSCVFLDEDSYNEESKRLDQTMQRSHARHQALASVDPKGQLTLEMCTVQSTAVDNNKPQ